MVKAGKDRGAVYGWKNIEPPHYPFIYSEIAGYAMSCFSWVYDELGYSSAINEALQCSRWIIRNLTSDSLVAAGKIKSPEFIQKGHLSDLFYAFDNGMVLIGLLNLHKITKRMDLLTTADLMGHSIVSHFYNRNKLTALLDGQFKPISNINGNTKWSSLSGAYHCKLSIGLLELSRLTNNKLYSKISNSVCKYGLTLQRPDGRFITGSSHDLTYMHPHLYACEGLIYAGIAQHYSKFYRAGLNGIRWAIKQLQLANGKLPRSTGESTEQSDCIAQLLRLVILTEDSLIKFSDISLLIDNIINGLYFRLLDFYIPKGEDRGGMQYNLKSQSACSWCTMFSMQALRLWNKRKRRTNIGSWIDYFV